MIHFRLKPLLIATICVYVSLNGLVIESDTIKTVHNHVDDPETLVIFDIDNTLITSTEDFGGDTWYYHMLNTYMHQGLSRDAAAALIKPIVVAVQPHAKFIPTEACTLQLIHDVKKRAPVIALTARSLSLVDVTQQILNNIGIDFTKGSLPGGEINIRARYSAKYKYGILFCRGNNKGAMLLRLFDLLKYYPAKIVFVDDKMKNIVAVEQMVEELGIEFVGIRYSGCDERIKNFDAAYVEKQHELFVKEHADLIKQCAAKIAHLAH